MKKRIYPTPSEIAYALSEKTGVKLTAANYEDWKEGGPTYNKFERAVRKFMGKQDVEKYEVLARLPEALAYRLFPKSAPKEMDGIDVTL